MLIFRDISEWACYFNVLIYLLRNVDAIIFDTDKYNFRIGKGFYLGPHKKLQGKLIYNYKDH